MTNSDTLKMDYVFDLPNEAATECLAKRCAAYLVSPLLLTFTGEIGAGKTTFIRAMLRALGVSAAIKSPTFSIVESYQLSSLHIHHFDLYRIHDQAELEYIGFRDYFTNNAICCIEWPEQASHYLETADIGFTLVLKGAGRELHAHAFSSAGIKILSCLAGK